MQKKNSYLIGKISKLHGYRGEVKIYNQENTPLDFKIIQHLFIEIDNELIPFIIESARLINKNMILTKFEDVNSENAAKLILQKNVYVDKKSLPKKIVDRNPSLIGFKIIDKHLGELGLITQIDKQTYQELIFVKKNETSEFCFPMHDNFIKKINLKKKTIQVIIPEELINLN